jgi:acyl-CoA synthetase (AMP-forming)/AMP-acid ligase II
MRMPLPQWIATGAGVLGAGSPGERSTTRDLEEGVAEALATLGGRDWTGPVGLLADNSPYWISVDLAAHCAGHTLVPLPGFFSPAQLQHIVQSTGMEGLWCVDERSAASLGFTREVPGSFGLRLFERETQAARAAAAPGDEALQKVTFTSGSTGAPKGVCLTAAQQLRTARALAQLTASLGIARHLTLLPLSVLLENVADVYAPLLLGATCICPPLDETGMSGASGFDAERCLRAIERYAPDSIILLPQMLRAMPEFTALPMLTTPTVAVWNVTCPGHIRHVADEECATSTHLIYPYRGAYWYAGTEPLWSIDCGTPPGVGTRNMYAWFVGREQDIPAFYRIIEGVRLVD